MNSFTNGIDDIDPCAVSWDNANIINEAKLHPSTHITCNNTQTNKLNSLFLTNSAKYTLPNHNKLQLIHHSNEMG